MAEQLLCKNRLDIHPLEDLLFSRQQLKIPDYQRPYRWKAAQHVKQLLKDIQYAVEKGNQEYRIGTVILHKTETSLDIVDGQQRLVTLSLICRALKESAQLSLLSATFDHIDSKNNIKYNYGYIENYLKEVTNKAALLDFIKEKCSVVVICLTELSEAFQLFDSQNARGKTLQPTDLLKAYHLRLLEEEASILKKRLVSTWEDYTENRGLNEVLGDYVFRLRNWQRQDWRYTFTKEDIAEFKGISLTDSFKKGTVYPYMKVVLMNSLNTTFQVQEKIVNGKRFFEFSAHYVEMYHQLLDIIHHEEKLKKLFEYWGRHRTGDRRLKNLYVIILMAYYDKFGQDKHFEDFAKELYRWVFTTRLKQKRISYQTIINLLKNSPNNPLRQIERWYEPDILGLRDSIPKLKTVLNVAIWQNNEKKENKLMVTNGQVILKLIEEIEA